VISSPDPLQNALGGGQGAAAVGAGKEFPSESLCVKKKRLQFCPQLGFFVRP